MVSKKKTVKFYYVPKFGKYALVVAPARMCVPLVYSTFEDIYKIFPLEFYNIAVVGIAEMSFNSLASAMVYNAQLFTDDDLPF